MRVAAVARASNRGKRKDVDAVTSTVAARADDVNCRAEVMLQIYERHIARSGQLGGSGDLPRNDRTDTAATNETLPAGFADRCRVSISVWVTCSSNGRTGTRIDYGGFSTHCDGRARRCWRPRTEEIPRDRQPYSLQDRTLVVSVVNVVIRMGADGADNSPKDRANSIGGSR